MEDLVETYKGKRVMVTGHTGFKGSWLRLWLTQMGAVVDGFGLPPHTNPNHFEVAGGTRLDWVNAIGGPRDLRQFNSLMYHMEDNPEIVFHLAAQAIVKQSFLDPQETFSSNIVSAVNVLEACRRTPSVKAIVVITSDKVYQDQNWGWGYREVDQLGGTDPYSASKVCVEQIAASYRESFNMNIATARAGNVIGGGDWGAYRLIPDVMRATSEGKAVEIHTPHATRPYQHVLESLHGYLRLGKALLEGREECKTAFNFGPDGSMSVLEVLEIARKVWPKIQYVIKEEETHPGMVSLLKIDSTKAKQMLGWKPNWTMEHAIRRTVLWYRSFYEDGEIRSMNDIEAFEGVRT